MCGGALELVYNRNAQQVMVCADCHTGVTVPDTAWKVAPAQAQSEVDAQTLTVSPIQVNLCKDTGPV